MQVRVPRALVSWPVLAATVALLLPSVGVLAAPAGGEFPYVAYVVEPDSYIRSGPGREHYPTGQLPAGYAVEVYRHDGAGWCAIRPPEGSFSLAPIHQLRLVDERTAEVAAGGVVARVGSALGGQHSAVQVMLERGERIALLEKPSPVNPWVRIAPPAGEFRWIAARRLSRTPPMESTAPVAADAGWQSHALARGTEEHAAEPGEIADSGDSFAHLQNHAAAVPTPLPVQAPADAPPVASAPGGSLAANGVDGIEIIPGSPAAVRQAQYQTPVAEAQAPEAPPLAEGAASAPLSTPPRVRFEGHTARGPLDPRVAEMQLRLSQIVVGQPTGWQFVGLREETAALLAQEPSPEVREQLRDLLDRIATFETVQSRYRTLPASRQLASIAPPALQGVGAESSDGLVTSDAAEVLARVRRDLGVDNGITPTPGGPTPSATEALYDAVGTLKPVVSRRQGAPQFALIDDHGDVVTFVTASTDVNLQEFVGQRIGVRGSRGFMPEYRRAHVTASRVTPLEQTLVK